MLRKARHKTAHQEHYDTFMAQCIAEKLGAGYAQEEAITICSGAHEQGGTTAPPAGPDGRTPPGEIITRGKAAGDGSPLPEAKQVDVPLQIKSVDVNGDGDVTFSGWASVFNVVDSDNEIVAPGAFTACLKRWREAGRMPALLWQHDSREPVGRYDVIEEREEGLWVEGRLFVADIPRARQAARLLRERALDGLSIGFIPRSPVTLDEHTMVRTLYVVDLLEVSLVTFPALDVARVAGVKQATQQVAGVKRAHVPDIGTLAEGERFLRGAGFSKGAATAFVSKLRDCASGSARGDLGSVATGDDASPNADEKAAELLTAISGLTNQLKNRGQ